MSKEKVNGFSISYSAENFAQNSVTSVAQSSLSNSYYTVTGGTPLGASISNNYLSTTPAILYNGIPTVTTTYNGSDVSKYWLGWEDQLKSLELLGETVLKNSGTFPPYNIIVEEDGSITIELAIAGFTKNDVKVKQEKNALLIEGLIEEDKNEKKNYKHKGIATRAFTKAFALAEYVEVDSAKFKDGILTIKLVRNLPEEEKPRQIDIK